MTKSFVRVMWDDAEDPETSGWMSEDEISAFAAKPCIVQSVGYLVHETERHVTLAADWIAGHATYGRVTRIPRAMIVSIEALSVVEAT